MTLETGEPARDPGRPASFLRRLGALAIDIAAIYALDFVITLPIGSVWMARGGPTPAMVEEAVRWPLVGADLIGFWSAGSTPGMRSLGLEVLVPDGGKPGPILAAVRFAVFGGFVAVSGMFWLLPLVPYAIACAIGFYPHDFVARTTVRDAGLRLSGGRAHPLCEACRARPGDALVRARRRGPARVPRSREAQEGEIAMAAAGIHHIYIETHNWGKSVAFWRALGFELEEDRGKPPGLLRLRGGGPYIHVAEIPAERELKIEAPAR